MAFVWPAYKCIAQFQVLRGCGIILYKTFKEYTCTCRKYTPFHPVHYKLVLTIF